MITGKVSADLEPVIYLRVTGDGTMDFTLPFGVGTGFSEYLSLSTDVITALALPFKDYGDIVLADNSVTTRRIYQVTVIWDGQKRLVAAYEMERPNLVGMKLMRGYKLTVEAQDGGSVTIEANP